MLKRRKEVNETGRIRNESFREQQYKKEYFMALESKRINE